MLPSLIIVQADDIFTRRYLRANYITRHQSNSSKTSTFRREIIIILNIKLIHCLRKQNWKGIISNVFST